MNGVILPDFCRLAAHTPWKSEGFYREQQELKDAETTRWRIAQAEIWEMELRQRLANWRVSGEDPVKLRLKIKDAIWCQGAMFVIPRQTLTTYGRFG